VTDIKQLAIKECVTRNDLMSYVATHWSFIKHQFPFNLCRGKKEVLADLAITAGHAGHAGHARVVKSTDMRSDLNKYHPVQLAMASYHLKCDAATKSFHREIEALPFTRDTLFGQTGFCPPPDNQIRQQLAIPAQVLFRNKVLPKELHIGSTGISIGNGTQTLEFEWYRQLSSGIIDLESLHDDCLTVLSHPPTNMVFRRCSLDDIAKAYGIRYALQNCLDIARIDRVYPGDVVPFFDLSAIHPESQYQAYRIYCATGRFAQNIMGFQNSRGDSIRFKDWISAAKRKKEWYSRVAVSVQDFCLLRTLMSDNSFEDMMLSATVTKDSELGNHRSRC
jgi:hypothetical protein